MHPRIQQPTKPSSQQELSAIETYGKFFVLSNDGAELIKFTLETAMSAAEQQRCQYIDVFNEVGRKIGALAHASVATTADDIIDWNWTVDF